MLAGRPFTVVGDGTQSRDFTFVSDVADAFVTAAQSAVTGEVFNVGTGAPVPVNRLDNQALVREFEAEWAVYEG